MIILDSSSHTYRSPWVAAAWSLFLPGFGQLYNRDLLIGFSMVILEFIINMEGKINLSIFYTFNGYFQKSHDIMDFQWALFYPCIYTFAAWQAYNRAKEINKQLQEQGIAIPERKTYHNGFFMGMLIGLLFGLQWGILDSPIFGALLGGAVGTLLGILFDKRFKKG
ncbi:MAG: hypothetical protein ACOY46_18260 [Bacillota bacterium]